MFERKPTTELILWMMHLFSLKGLSHRYQIMLMTLAQLPLKTELCIQVDGSPKKEMAMGSKHGPMAPDTLASGSMTKLTVSAPFSTHMETSMKDLGKTTNHTVKAFTQVSTALATPGTGLTTFSMASALKPMLMGLFTRGSTTKVRKMDLENSFLPMGRYTRGISDKMRYMEPALSNGPTEKSMLVNGKIIECMDKEPCIGPMACSSRGSSTLIGGSAMGSLRWLMGPRKKGFGMNRNNDCLIF